MFFRNSPTSKEGSYQTRFELAKFCQFVYNTPDILGSFFIRNLKNLESSGLYKIRIEEHRPDILSYNLYQDTQYWWILLLYNDIIDPYDLKLGMDISYPTLSSLETFYFSIKSSYNRTYEETDYKKELTLVKDNLIVPMRESVNISKQVNRNTETKNALNRFNRDWENEDFLVNGKKLSPLDITLFGSLPQTERKHTKFNLDYSKSLYADINISNPTKYPVVYDIDSIYQSLTNIFGLIQNSVIFFPSFPSNIEDFLFDLVDEPTSKAILSLINNKIPFWEPRIKVKNTSYVEPSYEYNGYDIHLEYEVKGLSDQKFEYATTLYS